MNVLSERMMSEKDDSEEDQELLVKTRPKTKKPPLYKVLLINDDYTPMEFVVMILERFFGLTHAQAFDIMITVHKKGLAVVGVFSYEVAETKVAQVMDCASSISILYSVQWKKNKLAPHSSLKCFNYVFRTYQIRTK